jgi:hypothetical protein
MTEDRIMTIAKRLLYYVLSAYIVFVFALALALKFAGTHQGLHLWPNVGSIATGQWIIGVSEILATALLFVPGGRIFGAAIASGIMTGAVSSSLFAPLGMEGPMHGPLFTMAWSGWISGWIVLAMSFTDVREWARTRFGSKRQRGDGIGAGLLPVTPGRTSRVCDRTLA